MKTLIRMEDIWEYVTKEHDQEIHEQYLDYSLVRKSKERGGEVIKYKKTGTKSSGRDENEYNQFLLLYG